MFECTPLVYSGTLPTVHNIALPMNLYLYIKILVVYAHNKVTVQL